MQTRKNGGGRKGTLRALQGGLTRGAVALAAVLIGSGHAAADEYTWDGTANNWNTAHWSPSGGGAKSDAPYTTAGHVAYVASGTAQTTTGEFMSSLRIMTNGTLWLPNYAYGVCADLWLAGGSFYKNGSQLSTLAGTLVVAADSQYVNVNNGGATINSAIVGSGDISLSNVSGTGVLNLNGENGGFSGNWLANAAIMFSKAAAVGTGSVTVGSGGTLVFATGVTLTNIIDLRSGALGRMPNGVNATAQNLRLSGGKIQYAASGSGSLAGGVDAASDSVLDAPGSGSWTLSAAVTGNGRLLKTGTYSLYVTGNNAAYAGEWRAGAGTSGALEFRALNALGTGALATSNNATLRLGVQSDWSIVNDLAGSGFIEVGQTGSSGAGHRTLNLLGSAVLPGIDGKSGILTVRNGRTPTTLRCNLAFARDGSAYSALDIDVTGAGGAAGVDHDQLALTYGNLSGLANADLSLNIAPALAAVSSQLNGQTLTIATSPYGIADENFHSVTVTPGWNADVVREATAVKVVLSTAVAFDDAGVTDIAADSAAAFAMLKGLAADVYLFWDTDDRGQNPDAWAATNHLGATAPGAITNSAIAGLNAGQTYCARYYGVNTATGYSGWSLPLFFSPVGQAAVDNGAGAASVTQTDALLQGTVLGGNPDPDVWIYWGTQDGGTVKNDWNNEPLYLGVPGLTAFATNVTGLLANREYWYRCYVSNAVGEAWAPASTNFTTAAPTLSFAATLAVDEGPLGSSTPAVLTVTLSHVSALAVSLDFATVDGTATAADGDYVATAGKLTMVSGETSGSIAVTINGDHRYEGSETFDILFSGAVNVAPLTNDRVTVTIVTDDNVVYVRGDGLGGDANDGGSWATAWATLQQALDSCVSGAPMEMRAQASTGSQSYAPASRVSWGVTPSTFTMVWQGGWMDVDGTPVQGGLSRVADTDGAIDRTGLYIYSQGDNGNRKFQHYVTVSDFAFTNVTEGIRLQSSGDGCKKSLALRNVRVHAQGRGLVVDFPHNYASAGYGMARLTGENVDVAAGLGGAGGGTNHAIYVHGAWTGSGITASGVDPATGWPRVSTLRSADGCGIYMESTSISDVETCRTLISNTVVYASSGHGIYLAGDAGSANFDPVQATLRHCTIADNGGDGLRLEGRGSASWAAVTDSLFTGNGGYAVNLGSAAYPVFSCTEDYDVLHGGGIMVAGVPQAPGAMSSTADPRLVRRLARPAPWYWIAASDSPAYASGSDGLNRGAYQNQPPASGTLLILR